MVQIMSKKGFVCLVALETAVYLLTDPVEVQHQDYKAVVLYCGGVWLF